MTTLLKNISGYSITLVLADGLIHSFAPNEIISSDDYTWEDYLVTPYLNNNYLTEFLPPAETTTIIIPTPDPTPDPTPELVDTTTKLTSDINPSVSGNIITFTVIVSPTNTTGTVTGTVTLVDDGITMTTAKLIDGATVFSTSSLAIGSHSIIAYYNGSTTYAVSTSNIIIETVVKRTTTTSISSNVNPSIYGQAVTLAADVSPTNVTGTITFKEGTTTLGTGTITEGIVTYETASFSVGSHSLTATYNGDSYNEASTSSALIQVVNAAVSSSAVVLVSNNNPSVIGESITFSALVSPGAVGTVTFLNDSTILGISTLANSLATYTTSSLALGSHNITALYNGGTNFSSSVSSTFVQTVATLPSAIELLASENPTSVGETITLAAVVTPYATGNVTFYQDGISLGTSVITDSVALLDITFVTEGTYNLTAAYNGSTIYESSVSNTIVEVVTSATVVNIIAPDFVSWVIYSGGAIYTNGSGDATITMPTGNVYPLIVNVTGVDIDGYTLNNPSSIAISQGSTTTFEITATPIIITDSTPPFIVINASGSIG